MLQASNQYLRPDYLAAPNALDTKSSPLALLAQTCSAIGADTTNPKLLAANIEKSTKSLKSPTEARDKSSPVSSHSSSVSTGSVEQQQIKSSFKPYESNNNHMRDRLEAEAERERAAAVAAAAAATAAMATNLSQNTNNSNNSSQQQHQQQQQQQQQIITNHRVKTPKSNNVPQNGQTQQRCDSNQSATSARDSPASAAAVAVAGATNGLRRTPSVTAMDLQQHRINNHNNNSNNTSSSSPQRASSKESAALSVANHTALSQASPSTNSTRLQAASDAALAAAAKEASYVKALHAAAAAASGVPGNSGTGSGAYYPSYATGAPPGMPYPMDLMTASALMSPHHPMFKAAALNPYLNYARLKSLDASTAAAMMSPNICRDPYCTGCPSNPHFLNKAAGQPCPAGCPQCDGKSSGAGGGGGSSAAAAAAAAASSYHAQLAALAAASQLPYVCSWIGGDTAYCGKRFGTSDELFQHLRTHTASMPDSVLSAAAAGGIPPNHPLFQRTYPTPPLSPLSAARYHPYGKPSMLPPSLAPPPGSLAGLPMPPHPALAQYFSPYSLYGPRMGSSHP